MACRASVRLLVPLFGAGGRPLGVLVLGDKRSGLPFTDDDRKLMAAVAASAALSLEHKLQSESPDPDPDAGSAEPPGSPVRCLRPGAGPPAALMPRVRWVPAGRVAAGDLARKLRD